jgi:hypothetical protein
MRQELAISSVISANKK